MQTKGLRQFTILVLGCTPKSPTSFEDIAVKVGHETGNDKNDADFRKRISNALKSLKVKGLVDHPRRNRYSAKTGLHDAQRNAGPEIKNVTQPVDVRQYTGPENDTYPISKTPVQGTLDFFPKYKEQCEARIAAIWEYVDECHEAQIRPSRDFFEKIESIYLNALNRAAQ